MIGMIMNLSGSGEKSILNLIKKKLHIFCLLDLYLKNGEGGGEVKYVYLSVIMKWNEGKYS